MQTHLSLSHPVFRDAVAEISAGIRGCAKDEIVGEDIRQHTRTLRIEWSAIATLGLLTIVSIFAARIALQQRSVAEAQRAVAVEQSQIALARQLAAQSTSVRVQFPDRLPLAVLLAAESARLHPSFEGTQALREASTLLPRPPEGNTTGSTTGPSADRKMIELQMEFKHGAEVRQVMFSPNGQLLAAISTDGGISLSGVARKESRRVWSAGVSGLGLAFSQDGKRVATANGSLAYVWDVATGRELFKAMHATSADSAESPLHWVDSVALSPDANYLASAGRDGTARVWNLTTGQELIRLTHGAPVEAVAFSRDGGSLSTGSFDGTARLWELRARVASCNASRRVGSRGFQSRRQANCLRGI